jgi:hypothetical protein
MKISTGIAEIGFNSSINNRIASETFYVWPQYKAGQIEKIRGVVRRTESNVIYSKPLPEEREKLLAHANDHANHEYSSTGKVNRTYPSLQPGSLFDAIV